MHDLDPVFEAFSYTPQLAAVAHDIGLADPLALQSMYIFKQPHIGGEVGCHQDAPFLYTDPITVTGFWFAIEDATLDNGCLWAAARWPPRSAAPRVPARPRRRPTTRATRFVELDDTPLPTPPDGLVPIVAPAGHDGRAARPAAALERRQPLTRQPPRLQPALHLRGGRVPVVELAAAAAAMPLRRLDQAVGGASLTRLVAHLATACHPAAGWHVPTVAPAERRRSAARLLARRRPA